MFISQETAKFIDEIERVEAIEDLDRYVLQTSQRINGTEYLMVGSSAGVTPDPNFYSGNYPEEWLQRYFSRQYFYTDPVNLWMMERRSPVDWSQLRPAGYLQGRSRDVMNECHEFGIREGLTIPIINTDGQLGGVTFAASEFESTAEVKSALQLIAVYYFARLQELLEITNDNASPPKLTSRERECLHWVAAGKTDWEIGEILFISEITAHKHVESAKRKFGVPTRVQAVVEGARHKLIRI